MKKNAKMNLLIFCDILTPPAFLPRVRYFCDFFAKNGYNLTLITENFPQQQIFSQNFPLYLIDYYRFKKGVLSKIEWFFKVVLNLIYDDKGRFFYKKSNKFIKNKKFDLVLCSCTFHSFPLTTAAKVAKKLNLPFFADLRDIIEQTPIKNNAIFIHKFPSFLGKIITKKYKKIHINRRNKVIKNAACITSVSNWHVQFLRQFNPNTHLIYNGFDENFFIPNVQKSDKFFISYFGTVYSEKMSNPKVLFEAIKNIKNKISAKNLQLRWFVDENSKKNIQKIAQQFDIEEFISFEKFVYKDKLLFEMNNSSILVVLCNAENVQNFSGIMTTKFFEYIGVNRPVLCTPNNNDELAETINAIGCGLVSSDVEEVENFILEKYAEWQKNGFTKGTVSEENREKFSRKNGAEFLEKLLISK